MTIYRPILAISTRQNGRIQRKLKRKRLKIDEDFVFYTIIVLFYQQIIEYSAPSIHP